MTINLRTTMLVATFAMAIAAFGAAAPAHTDDASTPDDHDNDGLSKHDELFTTHTNPFLADTDFDGINDGDEYRNGTNPLNPHSP